VVPGGPLVQGLRGLADWPRTRLRVLWSERSAAVKRSEGLKVRPTLFDGDVVAALGWMQGAGGDSDEP
jgi:hypothetical protein